MRRLTLCCCIAILIGCSKSKQQPAPDAAAAAPAAPAAPAPISLADVAGTWNMRTMADGSDSVLISYQLVATADPSGWMTNFPNRKPVPLRVVAVAGDSIVTEAGPYESVLRKGVQVTTHQVTRLQDGMLMGTTIARYSTSGPDSVLHLRFEGTRAP
jgi:hypothetical protein